MKNFNYFLESVLGHYGVFYDYDPELLKIAAEAVERLDKRKNEPWPSDELVKDLVDAGEKEYGK